MIVEDAVCPGVTLLKEPLMAAWPCVGPWGRAGAGRQCGPVLEHAEQHRALRLAEEASHGCHLPSGSGAGARRLKWKKIPEATRLRVGWGRGMNGRSRRP